MHLADASHFEEKAREAYLDDDFESSVDSYTKAVDLEPSADLFADRAQAYIKLGNFTEAVSDANEAIGLNPSLVKAYLRKGSACMKLGEYHTAKEALEKGSSLSKNDSRFAKLIEECQKHLRDEVTELEMPNTSLNAPSSVATLSSDEKATADQENETGHDMLQQVTLDEPSSVATVSSDEKDMADQENETGHNMLQEVNAVTYVKPKYRHDFYQKPEVVVVTIFAKGVAADEVSIDFGEQILSVGINKKGEDAYHFQPRLYGKIKPENCKYQILSAKIEIHLAKAEAIDWRSLEYSKEAAAPQRISVSSVGSQRPAYPSSKGKAADWDKLEAQVKQEEKDEKLDGDAALNKLFRDIFQNADEDMRRAMTKSFVESNGTVLSTNWKEVGAKKVESSPPDGMELKKWEI